MPEDLAGRLQEFGREWPAAQQHGDADALAALLTDDFKLVGPLGFVLDREVWFEQYRSGALIMSSVQWDDADVRAMTGRRSRSDARPSRPATRTSPQTAASA